jgi:superfamily II DNA or RNA helicase/HKD family nuclease
MMNRRITELQRGLTTAFVDQSVSSNLAYKPQFISNNYKQGQKVLSYIEDDLLVCDEFCISVAFITMSGITPLLQTFKELEKHNIKGRILTTNYLNFSEPKALYKLKELTNIELKMYAADRAEEGFHTKGYIFRKENFFRIIVGSSNMTMNALTKNKEWNTKIVSTEQGEYTNEILEEFSQLWDSQYALQYDDFIEAYTINYNIIKKQRKLAKESAVTSIEVYKLQPNSMQLRFIANLRKIRETGEKRALLISATGTGKTYASAFALREENPHKVLFLVHREQIAKQAIKSYQKVFDKTKTFGLLSGNLKDFKADYLFSTMQMMAKAEVRQQFSADEFQMIVIDEAHRAGASSYQSIMEYFEPEFWLGMTASPERTDNFDVYQAFDHNIAYEIRLQQALEENLLCPFHYFGITDLQVDGESVNEEMGLKDFNRLTSDERVNYVIAQTTYYGYSGERVKGLIFCSSKKEAVKLSEKFNERGYRTIALTGEDSQDKREETIERLVSDDIENYLDYILTVDIFNEGVDIPEINQVVMLRPTESPTVFVQQLGRGLRRADGKEYVVILDFIGNYKNNFLIPIALSGDRSYNKDNIRRFVMEGGRVIPGSSTIHFDEISKNRIFSAIDTANFSDIKLIKENYNNLKNSLGYIPAMQDFETYGQMDLLRIFDNKRLGSYYKFLRKYEPEYTVRLSESEEIVVEFISKKFASGKRVHELELLNLMLAYQQNLLNVLKKKMEVDYGTKLTAQSRENVVNVMTNNFLTGGAKKTYQDCAFLQKEGESGNYGISDSFRTMLDNPEFYLIVKELIEFGIMRYQSNYSNPYQDTVLVLYQKYTYEDVCRLLNWECNEVPLNIGGYKYDKRTKTFPVFINYDKDDDISDTIKYEDHFINERKLIAISKQGRTKDSEDIQNFLNAEQRGIKVELFVRKNKDDKISKEFYYLGRMKDPRLIKEFVLENTDKTAVEIEWLLETDVRKDIYDYIISS